MKIYNTDFDILSDIARLKELYSFCLWIVRENKKDIIFYKYWKK